MILPWMISEKDDGLLGTTNRSDAMGLLAVWSARARDLVPHLTEQTTDVRAFQILIEAYRLWERYEPAHPQHAGRLGDFFLLVEQAFARTVGRIDGAWPLPGARRVMARAREQAHIAISDPGWHLLDAQRANGVWGLYRGAARRAGLLVEDMTRLSAPTLEAATRGAGLGVAAQRTLFALVCRALDGEAAALPVAADDPLCSDLYKNFHTIPLADHLRAALIDGHALNALLAGRLVGLDRLAHRGFIVEAASALEAHSAPLADVLRCEALLAVVEAVFLWLCASKGVALAAAAEALPVELERLEAARVGFGASGIYRGEAARTRHDRLCRLLDTSSKDALARAVLALHKQVSDERRRAAWVWEEGGLLRCDVDVERPGAAAFEPALAWRNDYYLEPLRLIARQLAVVRS